MATAHERAIKEAERLQVKHVGFSGGVAYNEYITASIRKAVEKAGFRFLVHHKIPAGDGLKALSIPLSNCWVSASPYCYANSVPPCCSRIMEGPMQNEPFRCYHFSW